MGKEKRKVMHIKPEGWHKLNGNKVQRRNEPCFCGSGKKFKNCHIGAYQKQFILPKNK